MDETAFSPPRSTVGGLLLIVGAVAFGTFWVLGDTSITDRIPWVPGLAVHALGIFSLAGGTALLVKDHRRPSSARATLAVGALFVGLGLVALFPALAVGSLILAAGLRMSGWSSAFLWPLVIGALGLGAALAIRYAQVGNPMFGEDSPLWAPGTRLAFQVSVAVLVAGLIAIGVRRLPERSSASRSP